MFLAATICLLAAGAARGLQCKDENGGNVDWFYVYKLPKIPGHKNPMVRQGFGHVYITSRNPKSDWTLAERSVNDTKSMLGRTLAPLYDPATAFDLFHVMYNDDPPTISSTPTYGHTKGVIFGDKNSSVWIMHSVPRFPNPPLNKSSAAAKPRRTPLLNRYEFPTSGRKFGQTLLCLSLPWNSDVNEISSDLFFRTRPRYYSARLPDLNPGTGPGRGKASGKRKGFDPSKFYEKTFATVGKKSFTIYGKSKDWLVDIYSHVVAPDFEDSFRAETWRNGGGDPMEPYCDGDYHVNNVQKLSITLSKDTTVDFKSSQDHSKWAISSNRTYAVCIGDLNRMEPQKKRGGGIICTKDKNVWKRFRQIIEESDEC